MPVWGGLLRLLALRGQCFIEGGFYVESRIDNGKRTSVQESLWNDAKSPMHASRMECAALGRIVSLSDR